RHHRRRGRRPWATLCGRRSKSGLFGPKRAAASRRLPADAWHRGRRQIGALRSCGGARRLVSRAGSLLFLQGDSAQCLLSADAERPADVSEYAVSLHLVDQRRDKGTRRADQVRQVLLGDSAQIRLAAMRAALSVALGQGEQDIRQASRYLLESEAKDSIAQSAHPVGVAADDI